MAVECEVVSADLNEALAAELDRLSGAGLLRTLRPVSGRQGARVRVDGREMLDFSSNDYLALAGDPRVAAAATAALASGPLGAGAARLISGDHPLHEALERALADYKRTEAALLFGSGYLANIGTIPALVGPRDVIYADRLNHASLIDGCRLSRAEVRTFAHNDMAALADMLAADRGRFRRRLIVVDSVFSMDGDLAPLCELVPLARAYDAWTYVDDAHATGVLGQGGRGSAEHWAVEGQIDVIMGTLGKALGTAGAFIAGSRTLIDYLTNRARAFVYTTASPPAIAAAALEALRIATTEPERRTRLRAAARRLRSGLGIDGPNDGHIIPIPFGDADRTMRVAAALNDQGFLVGAIRPPTVPDGTSRLRLTVSAAHEPADIDALLTAVKSL
ncbi:MAG TPA: 8-amino-7-oxononanoate synthase [Gemmatimonadaceae bacterium]|nr:8-amino-7-oxononanoate synthase [Gemmatimonadaceae bacterium]